MELAVVPAFSVRPVARHRRDSRRAGARRRAIVPPTRAGRRDQPAQGRRRKAAWRSGAGRLDGHARDGAGQVRARGRRGDGEVRGDAATPASVPATTRLPPRATDAAGQYDTGYEVVEYPHIQRRHVPKPATARVKVIDVSVAPGRAGRLHHGRRRPGAAGAEQLGARVELISPEQLASGDLSQYSVIVTGVRAYERRPDLRANNQRLLAYAENGGTVLVQYNKFEFNEAQYGPYPAKVSSGPRHRRERADRGARAGPSGLHRRRTDSARRRGRAGCRSAGCISSGERDPRYVDLVQSSDPFDFNAGAKTGALVEARVGKGRWIYIGLGLWRQLPAGTRRRVPPAWPT